MSCDVGKAAEGLENEFQFLLVSSHVEGSEHK